MISAALRVYGLKGPSVVDASVLPRPIEGNTKATTVMITKRAAAEIRGAAHAFTESSRNSNAVHD